MRTTIKALLYLLICFTFVAITGCSKDDVSEDNPKPIQPEKPNPDHPKEPDLATELLGEWTQSETNLGSMVNVTSTSRVRFGTSDSLTVNWCEKGRAETPYTTAKGKYTLKGDSLRLKWITIMTDSVLNTTFSTFYLSGKCSITGNTLNYDYSVYDTTGDKLSGPHTTKFAKQ